MAANKMKFLSKDNQIFEVDEEVAKQNNVIRAKLKCLSESIDYIYYMILVFKLFILHIIMLILLRDSQANEVPISSRQGSARRHSIGSKTIKKFKQLKKSFMAVFGPAQSFKTMNRPDHNAL